MSEAADYSFARPSPSALVGAGYKDVIRYLSPPPNAKNITLDELKALRDVGLGVALVWEWVEQRAFVSGASGGAADAPTANQLADALGYPNDCVIYFVLEDPNQLPDSTWPRIDEYADAVKARSARPIGGYGSQAHIEHAIGAGLITKGWQVGGWSTGVSSTCHLLQRSSNPVLTIMGGSLDDNFIIDEDFGQWKGAIDGSSQDKKPVPVVGTPDRAPDGNPFTVLVADGMLGDHTIRALQWKIGTPADGYFGRNSDVALQAYLGVAADGGVGPMTIKALQQRVGSAPDGVWGPGTTMALQERLNAGTF